MVSEWKSFAQRTPAFEFLTSSRFFGDTRSIYLLPFGGGQPASLSICACCTPCQEGDQNLYFERCVQVVICYSKSIGATCV